MGATESTADIERNNRLPQDRSGRSADVKHAVAALILTSLLYLYWSVSGSLYIYLDNMTVSMVSAGMFGEGYFCQYIHPLLNVLVYGLSRIMFFADAFALIMHIVLFFGVFMITLMGIGIVFRTSVKSWKLGDWILAVLMLLSVLFFAVSMNIWGVNYTVQTAAILFSGLVTLAGASVLNKGKTWIVAGTVLIAFGYMVRLETALLFIPFISLELIAGILNSGEKRAAVRKAFRHYGAALLAAALLLASKGVFNSFEPYASDNSYTAYRTVVEDYPMAPYAASGAEEAGIDQTTYDLVCGNWVLFDTDRIDAVTLKSIAESGGRNAFDYDLQGLQGALGEIGRRLRETDIYLLILALITCLLTIGNLLSARSKYLKCEAVFAFLGGFVILLYFTFRGRALFRVWQTVLLAINAVLVCNTFRIRQERQDAEPVAAGKRSTAQTLIMLLMCILLYYSAGQVIAHTSFHSPISPLTSRINADDSVYEETYEGDGLYLWSNWYLMIPSHFADQNKLPTQRVIDHNIPVGDWIYGQVYFREYLAERNADNPAAALVGRPDTYLMDGFVGNLLEYMREFYGEDLTLTEAGEINGVTAYRFTHGNG